MNSDKVKIKDILELINRNKYSALAVIGVCLGFSMGLSEVMTKRFKSQFEINIYSKYFQNPLISEIVPGVYNIPEMRFTIDSMVKEAISDDYIDQLATEHGMYALDQAPEEIALKRQFMRERFKYYSTGGQSYRVVYEDEDPYRAKVISERTLERVKSQFINSRIQTIEIVKSIMLDRLKDLNASHNLGASGSSKALASRSPEVLMAELSKINANISALSKQYNLSHPRLQDLLLRKRTVSAWLEEFQGDMTSATIGSDALAVPVNDEINNNLTGEFLTKFHNFNMALDIEKQSLESYFGVIERPQLPTSPVWPKKRLFGALGFLLGVMFAFLYIFLKEVLAPARGELLAAEAKKLGAMYLGEFSPKSLESVSSPVKEDALGYRSEALTH